MQASLKICLNRRKIIIGGLVLYLCGMYIVMNMHDITETAIREDGEYTKSEGKVLTNAGMIVDKEQEQRIRTLRQQCTYHRLDLNKKSFDFSHILVDNKHKTLFCNIPHIAFTQWEEILLSLTGNFRNRDSVDHTKYNFTVPKLSQFSQAERAQMLREYKKIIFVRNPFERLLSAYISKFTDRFDPITPNMKLLGREIIKIYRPNATVKAREEGNDVTFLEFAKYLSGLNDDQLDIQWTRYHDLCHTCYIDYDFIGKYESLERDSDLFLKYIGAPPDITFPNRSEKYKSTELKLIGRFYSDLPMTYMAKLWEMYKYDCYLFGYALYKTF